MTRSAAGPRPADRLLPVLWAGLAVGVALAASVLAGALADSSLTVLVGTSITRSAMDTVGVACVGLTLVGVLLPISGPTLREATLVQARADRAVVVAAGAWVVLVLIGVAFRAADGFGRPVTDLGGGDVLRWVTALAAGRGMVLTAGCAAVVLGCGIARMRDPQRVPVRVALIAALLGVLTPAVTGHASSSADHQIAVTTVALHVGAAAAWVGGLAAVLLLVARRRPLLDVVLPRFSRLAGVCLAAVAVTGLLNAYVRLPSLSALVTTGYGWLVITKVGCILGLACLGGLARHRLATGRTPVLRWAGYETALMATTLGVAAALTQTA